MADTKTLWLLGAGASKSESDGVYPALQEIPVVTSRYGLFSTWDRDPGYACLRKYVQRRFAVDLSRGPRIDLERVLTLLEIDISVTSAPELALARHHLLRLIRETFAALAADQFQPAGHYAHLVQSLQDQDTLLTFNWDCLLDDKLGRHEKLATPRPHDWPNGQYGKFLWRFTAVGDNTIERIGIQEPFASWEQSNGLYIKAHGSVDWYQCVNHSCRNLGALFPLMDTDLAQHCGWCFEPMEVLIVPPTLNKRLRENALVRRLWTAAAAELQSAERLAIWGYSLPSTDFFSNWLLKHANPQKLQEVVIIDPSVCRLGKSRATLNRQFIRAFLDLLPVKGGSLTIALYQGYADFMDHRELQNRYPELAGAIGSLRAGGD